MATHGALMRDFIDTLDGKGAGEASQGFDFASSEHRRLARSVALHTADVSNPTKPPKLMALWTKRVMSEFWLQGDAEKARGWKPSQPMLDRVSGRFV